MMHIGCAPANVVIRFLVNTANAALHLCYKYFKYIYYDDDNPSITGGFKAAHQ